MSPFQTRVSMIAITALTLAGVPQVFAQSTEQIQERVALGFVEKVGAGDADALVEYIQANFAEGLLSRRSDESWTGLAKQLGRHAGLEIAGISIDEPGRVVVEAESPAGMTISFGFDFEPEAPERIAGLGLEAGGGGHRHGPELPDFELSESADREAIVSALDSYFAQLEEDELFPGTVLIAIDGESIYSGAWGLASREWNAPSTLDTRFDLGSINKSFTKIAIGQLLLAGKLTLDDTIADHLPDYPNAEVAAKVNIRHLLEHSSGIGDIFNEKFSRTSKALFRKPSDFFFLFAEEPLAFEPGTGNAYSNGGFMVLGAIVAAASGQPYDEYVVENIFGPAGMNATGFFAHDEPVPNVAVGYTHFTPEGRGETLRNNLLMLPVRGNSAGSAQSTVADLLAFDNALREHRLLPPAWTAWYFGDGEPSEDAEVSSERSTAGTGIAGGAPGVSAVLESDGVLTIIGLSNYDEPGAEIVARKLRRPLRKAASNLSPGIE
jgi:CubicO group peptidase (beta-lactamase class C family)